MKKSVVIYTYFSSPSSDYNLNFFVKKELVYRTNIDYIIVINGHNFNKNIIFPTLENFTLLKRDNVGYDFGGHHCALEHLKRCFKMYDYYFFLNSGVIGPFIQPQLQDHWSSIFIKKINERVKLVGTTIVCLSRRDAGGYGPKVEGFFFMVDDIGLKVLEKQKTIFCNHKNKYSAIINGEYGLSNCMFKNGYTIDCMLPRYQNVDWTNPANYNLNNNKHPSRKNSFYNSSINPFDVIFHKWFWHRQENVNFDIVQKYVNETAFSGFFKKS